MKTPILIKQNVAALLRVRNKKAKDLAFHCYRSESWISKIFAESRRTFPYKYLDRMADFLGVSPYQLLQPGFAQGSERRDGFDRRTVKDRRVSDAQRAMLRVAVDIDEAHPRRKGPHEPAAPSQSPAAQRAYAIIDKQIATLVSLVAESGDETPTPRRKVAAASKSHRSPRGSDAGKARPVKTATERA